MSVTVDERGTPDDRGTLRRQFSKVRIAVPLLGFGVGLLPVVLYVVQLRGTTALRVAGFAAMMGLAAAVVGGLLGFLFGVPRYARVNETATQDSLTSLESDLARTRWYHNTNLEQVSDWLTKILVGVGLTQFRSIGDALGRLVHAASPGLGNTEGSAAFAGFVLAYFGALGFMVSYILTVSILPRFLARQHRRTLSELTNNPDPA
ncbi:MAG TPA: hypothetical protein VNA20_05605 [Frankiaceae bacterium]|nr:hypothetical protein [Frankiaceae bacterium]